jgi:hypothetical protein
MSPEIKPAEPVYYAAFKLRFRALILDAAYCLGLFIVGGVVAGILLESSAASRIVVFLVILAVILAYEALYGSPLWRDVRPPKEQYPGNMCAK